MRTQNNFKKGALEMLLLHILNEKADCYGYQLSQLIQTLSDGYLVVPEGSMYPALYKLIEKGYITDYKNKVGKRLVRVYYHIEKVQAEATSYKNVGCPASSSKSDGNNKRYTKRLKFSLSNVLYKLQSP